MLFAFRGMRFLQVLMAFGALVLGVGAVLMAKEFADGGGLAALLFAFLLAALFLMLFGWTLRAPTSFVAIAPERTRIRYIGFFDSVIDNGDILGARMRNWPFWGGVGVRTNFGGEVALVSTWGPCVELSLREPVRVWIIPRLIPIRASKLILSVRNPERLVERFAVGAGGSPPERGASKVKHRGSRTR